jgi:hypothetical protein
MSGPGRKRLVLVLELAMVLGGAAVLVWQFFAPANIESGWEVVGGASAVSIGLMLLYEEFFTP